MCCTSSASFPAYYLFSICKPGIKPTYPSKWDLYKPSVRRSFMKEKWLYFSLSGPNDCHGFVICAIGIPCRNTTQSTLTRSIYAQDIDKTWVAVLLQQQETPRPLNIQTDLPQKSDSCAPSLLSSKEIWGFPKTCSGPPSQGNNCSFCLWVALLVPFLTEKPGTALDTDCRSHQQLYWWHQRRGITFLQNRRGLIKQAALPSSLKFWQLLPCLFLCTPVLSGCTVLSSSELARTGEHRNPAGVFALMQKQLSESRPNSE